MAFLRKPVLAPSSGLDYSIPSTLADRRHGFPKNARYWRGEVKKRPGKTKYGTVGVTNQVMGFGELRTSSGTNYILRASKTQLQKFNTSTNEWDNITSTPFTGGNENFFQFANVSENGIILITNGVDNIRQWNGSGNNSLLGGGPGKAKYITYVTPYVLLANLNEGGDVNPWKVKWNDTDAPETWSGGNSGSALLTNETSVIKNIIQLNEYAAVYKQKALWLGRKVETANIWEFDCVKTGVGLAASRAVAGANGLHYFMGENDFYVWNGARDESIGGAVRDAVFSSIDRSKIERCHALHVMELNEIWFFVILNGQDWPTTIWKYNYSTGFWYYDTCNNLTAAAKWQRVDTETWDDDTPGTWDSALDTWDAGTSVADWEEVLFGRDDGHSLKLDYNSTDDDGNAVDSWFETIDFHADKLEFNKRWLQLDFWAKGPGDLKFYYSTDFGNTWTYVTTHTLTDVYSKYECYFDVVSDQIRFRFRCDSSGGMFYLRAFYPYYLEDAQEYTVTV